MKRRRRLTTLQPQALLKFYARVSQALQIRGQKREASRRDGLIEHPRAHDVGDNVRLNEGI